MIDLTIPPTTTQSLALLPRAVPVAMLVRHAHRPPIPEGTYGGDIGLVPEGVALARELGRACQAHAPGRVATSPMPRCLDSARAIVEGAGWDVRVEADDRLGMPGPFVVDRGTAGPYFLAHGPRAVVAEQLTTGAAPGLRETREGCMILLQALLDANAEAGSLGVFVTHDSVLMALVGWLWAMDSLPDRWPRFLEGLFLWRGETGLHCRWRAEERTVRWPD